MSGVAQFVTYRGLHELKKWLEEGYKKIAHYDEVYADWLAIPKSIKMTSIKPSGTVSLLVGATPGVHYPEDVFYIRRLRIGKTSDLLPLLKDAGYKIEPCIGSEETTVVVEVPVKIGDKMRAVHEVSIWEQAALAAFMQRYWADNQVSCTITFKPEEANQIKHLLNFYQYQLKGISFLPYCSTLNSPYKQLPYEGISEKRYNELASKLKPVKFKGIRNEEADVEKGCNNDVCELKRK
jgi:ribonucleoside-triphosphate reductase